MTSRAVRVGYILHIRRLTPSWTKSMRPVLAACLTALLLFASLAVAHEDDPKARDWEPPIDAPIWHLGDGGLAGTFASDGVLLQSWFPITAFNNALVTNTSASDCWGYVSPSGREYAIIGLSEGTAWVEVTNPAQSTMVRFIAGPSSLWRNVKTYQHWCYAVSEGGGGIQVFDLANIDAGTVTELPSVVTGGVLSTHTMIINTQTGFLYRMGGSSSGIRIYNLAPNPAAPVYVGAWSDRYVHDGVVYSYTTGPYAGREIFFACGGLNGGHTDTGMDIIDVTNKAALQNLSRFTYSQAAYCHQVWLTDDRRFAYINDEIDEANFGIYSVGRIVNVENLSAPTAAGTYTTGVQTVDHNLYVKGEQLFCSNYKSGIRIFNIANPSAPVQEAWFDTYPSSDSSGYAGLWSNYPYFPSGTIIGSDLSAGLFVWRLGEPGGTMAWPGGAPQFLAPSGGSIDVSIVPNAGLSVSSASVTINPPSGHQVVPLVAQGGNLWRATLPNMACGAPVTFFASAQISDGSSLRLPLAGGELAVAAAGQTAAFNDTLEVASGWAASAAGDTATSGLWTRVDPNGTTAAPENDTTPAGTMCWVTGQGTVGGGAGLADVDGGITTLTSPLINASGLTDPSLIYWRWYSNNMGGAPNADSMPISISADNGTTWVLLEDCTENAGDWVRKEFRIADFVTPSAQMRLKFVARDLATGSLVEAGVDDVSLVSYDCGSPAIPGDLNGDGAITGADLSIMLGQWGTAAAADLDGNGTVDGGDLALLLANWG